MNIVRNVAAMHLHLSSQCHIRANTTSRDPQAVFARSQPPRRMRAASCHTMRVCIRNIPSCWFEQASCTRSSLIGQMGGRFVRARQLGQLTTCAAKKDEEQAAPESDSLFASLRARVSQLDAEADEVRMFVLLVVRECRALCVVCMQSV
jgi:hypothetical protein